MKSSYFLAGALGLGLSAIYILPPFEQVECALDTAIPEEFSSSINRLYLPSEKELKILASDTEFAKARCFMPRQNEPNADGKIPYDMVDLSVVLSGYDLANSIHRPERCMPAQGHKIVSSSSAELDLPNGNQIPLTRLVSKQAFETGPPEDRQLVTNECLTYYFFVGHDAITNSHTERTLLDIKDRVLSGSAQRWAYVSASMRFVEESADEGSSPAPPNIEMADKKIRELLSELADNNIDWDRIRS